MKSLEKKQEQKIELISNLILNGDLSKMSPHQKVEYYNRFCESLSLNPLTKPFQIISFQGKEILYATKDCTEQLRKINGVSIIDLEGKMSDGLFIVKAKVQDKIGRTDISTGAVDIQGLKGGALANAIMKTETKAKRRATLSICGLGILDESELDTMPKYRVQPVMNEPEKAIDIKIEKEKHDKFVELQNIYNEIKAIISDDDKLKYENTIQLFKKGKAAIDLLQKGVDFLKSNYNQTFQKKPVELGLIDDDDIADIFPNEEGVKSE